MVYEWVLGPITPIHYIDLGVSWSHHNSHEQQSVGYKFGSRVSLSYKSIGGLIKNSSCKHKGKFNSNSFEWWPLWPPLDFLRAFYDKKVFQIKGMNNKSPKKEPQFTKYTELTFFSNALSGNSLRAFPNAPNPLQNFHFWGFKNNASTASLLKFTFYF